MCKVSQLGNQSSSDGKVLFVMNRWQTLNHSFHSCSTTTIFPPLSEDVLINWIQLYHVAKRFIAISRRFLAQIEFLLG